nr:zeatin O-xylosyltransferase-like [Ipomoea trifida]
MDSCNNNVAVVMVPLPAQGHLNQLLQLCCLVSSYGHPVHYIGSAIHNQQARVRANGLDPKKLAQIHFHDLPTPDFDCPSPDPTASIKFPSHLQATWEASQLLRHPTAHVLRELASNASRVVIIHDPMMSMVVQDAALIPNAESYAFNCISVFSLLSFRYGGLGKQVPMEAELQELLPCLEGCATNEIRRLGAAQEEHRKLRAGDIHNSSRLIEGRFIDLLEEDKLGSAGPDDRMLDSTLQAAGQQGQKKKQWFIGPILPANPGLISNNHSFCLDWLDVQPQNSVLILKTGLIVREWRERHEVVKSWAIENVVRRLMGSEEGDEIRKRAQELGETIRKSAQEGGASRMELDSFIAHITR